MKKTTRPLVPVPMSAPVTPAVIDDAFIKSRIHTIRGEQMMLSSDLAELYDVEVKYLHRQVKRNQPRFPPDFVLHLSPDELKGLRCQIVTSNRGGDRYGLLAFTEQGVAMLSSVLKSERAAIVNVAIMRAFVDKLVRSARKSLLLVDNWATVETLDMLAAKQKGVAVTVVTSEHRDHFSRMPPRGSTAGGIRRLPGLASRLTRARAFCYSQIRQPHRALVDAGLPSPVKEL